MMKLFPAIDILDGSCVRLFQGDFEQRVNYERDFLEIALSYQEQGAEFLHLVDLDGARSGRLVNVHILEKLAESTKLLIDYGGGIKSRDDIKMLLDCGARQVTIGSVAVRHPDLFKDWLFEFGPSVILSADVNSERQIQIAGWKENSLKTVFELIEQFQSSGLEYVACTDVSKDGTMSGPSVALYRDILKQFPKLNLFASGGVACLADIAALNQSGLYGVIIGKALLDGCFSFAEAKNLSQ